MSHEHEQHRFHTSGGDSLGKSFEVHIHGQEFNFSDQFKTVVAGLHGEHVAEHAHFHIDGTNVPHHTLLDEHRGKQVHVSYLGPYHEKDHDFIKSFDIPAKAN
jgi:hypothetical protein